MKNDKEPFSEKLKSHMLDICVIILMACIGLVIFQGKKHEKEMTTKVQINKMMNDCKNVNTR